MTLVSPDVHFVFVEFVNFVKGWEDDNRQALALSFGAVLPMATAIADGDARK